MKIRLFALAKELGLDSKDLIQHCNDAGIPVKSSPLASVSPEERDVILAHLNKVLKPQAGKSEPAIPTRELDRNKVREIRQIAPVAPPRSRRPESDQPAEIESEAGYPHVEEPPAPESTVEEVRAVAPPEPAAPVAPVPPPSAPVPDGPVRPEPPRSTGIRQLSGGPRPGTGSRTGSPKAPGAAGPLGGPQIARPPGGPLPVAPPPPTPVKPTAPLPPGKGPVAPVPVAPAPVASVEPETTVDPGDIDDQGAEDAGPMRRDDYVHPRGLERVQEMRAVGSIRDPERRGGGTAQPGPRKERPKKPATPIFATPTFTQKPVVRTRDDNAPRPEVKLNKDILKNNKLVDIIRKNREDTAKGKKPAAPGEAAPRPARPGLTLEDQRAARRHRRGKSGGDDEDRIIKAPKRHRVRATTSTERKTEAEVTLPITIRTLSEEIGRSAKEIMTVLFRQGRMSTINDALTEDQALEIGMELGVDVTIVREDDVEDELLAWLERADEDFGVEVRPRPPIITILGHVDHGKTTLVDRIRSSSVAKGEAGGITQHIAAYQVEHGGLKLTFVDTPGHAAFGEMRARGANVTDIVVLVVAGDDGVMPQTVECISHAKAAGVPIVVALNKIDLAGVNEQRIFTELSHQGLLPVEWGGETEVCRVSGLQGTGVDSLLETLLLTADLQGFQAPYETPADGVCLEAFRDEGLGPLAWMIVRRGTLKVGDVLLCGAACGRIRNMYTDKGESILEAPPSTPVKVSGLDEVPAAGSHFFVVDDIDMAREVAETRRLRGRSEILSRRGGPRSLEEFFASRDGQVRTLPLIIKGDTPGSIEALKHELGKFEHPEVRLQIIHDGVGGVNESDVYLASSAEAIIIAFHVVAEDRAASLAEQEQVQIRRYNIIYNVTDDIRQALEGLLAPERVEVTTGRAIVLKTFGISKVGVIAGCRVLNGTIERSNRMHVIRDQKVLHHYGIASLKREKDDVKEVREGFECGIRLESFNDVKEGDILEAFKIEERKRSLDS